MPSSYQPLLSHIVFKFSFLYLVPCTTLSYVQNKFLTKKSPILCLLWFVCLFVKECRDFGPKDRGSSSLGFIAHDCLILRVLPVLLLFRLLSSEKNGKRRFETL